MRSLIHTCNFRLIVMGREVKDRFYLFHHIVIKLSLISFLDTLFHIIFTVFHTIRITCFFIIINNILFLEKLWLLSCCFSLEPLPTLLVRRRKALNRSIIAVIVWLGNNRGHWHVIVRCIQELVISLVWILIAHDMRVFRRKVSCHSVSICVT